MPNFLLICFILSLPAFSVLGYDIYMAYNNTELQGTDRFWLTDLGWLWINYMPSSYDWAVDNLDPLVWNGFVDPLLQQSAFYVALVFPAVFIIIYGLMKLLGLGSFKGQGFSLPQFGRKPKVTKKKGDFGFSGAKDKKHTKYKRK
ncbi:MAG: hypothetical protein CO093_08420 [Alphaproteobacteria bacterium CG_4_9_14_3_um_filter_47_13]|nr:MAG: hypothetical protein CO093_08420 [Alphaproteobacteria bacterium CG_4_9_14_3_um_filter_47_13]